MRFTLTVEMDNAAFEDAPGYELGRILDDLADAVRFGAVAGDSGTVRDYNGNTVGQWEVSA